MVRNRSSTKRIWWVSLLLFVAVAGFWGIRWATFARPPLPEAVRALESDDRVAVSDHPWLTFTPRQDAPNSGFIFCPGGRVDPRGYASLLKPITAAGYLVVVPEMPINMAPFDANVADEIMADHPDIHHWAIGGHSVGGTMAAQYAHRHRETIRGLAIWAESAIDGGATFFLTLKAAGAGVLDSGEKSGPAPSQCQREHNDR